MTFKKRITLTLIFLLTFNFLNSIPIFAENLSANLVTSLKVNETEVATNSIVDLKEKDIVDLEVKCINNDNLIKSGDEIKVILPSILKNVTIDYPIECFIEKSISNENTYLLIFSDTITNKSEVGFSIRASVSEIKGDLEDSILISMKDNETKINVKGIQEKLSGNIEEVSVLKENNDLEEDNEVNSSSESATFSKIDFKAIGVKDNTKILIEQYSAKNGFKYVKDGVEFTTSAFDFHIFSKEAILNSHTNGNIATKDLFANGSGFGTNQSTKLELNEENYFMNSADGIGNIASDGNIIVGYNVPTKLEDNNNSVNIGTNGTKLRIEQSSRVYKKTSESISYIDIDNEFENLKEISRLFSNHKTSEGVTLSALNGENQTITVNGSIENINNYYLNINASDISKEYNKRILNIVIPKGKTLIINIDMAGVNINYLQNLVTKINNYSNSEDVVGNENNILWNLYDSSADDKLFNTGTEYAKVGTSDYFMGTILAPNANIQYGAVNGSIIANETKQNYQESHKWSFTGHTCENEKISVVIEATKTLAGKKLVADMFSFELLAEDGNTVLQTVNNDIDGKIKFATITYDSAGTYKYKVKEVKGNLGGVNYDERVFDVTVNVIEGENGNLVATVDYQNNKIEFNNKYEAKATSVSLEATKTLAGKKLVSGMFSFELLAEDGNVLQTVNNDIDGKIKFATITYDSAGTYKYKVKEVKGNLGGVNYDERVFDIAVKVIDDEQDKLVATVSYPNNKIEFNNKYEAKATSVSLEATKTLAGKKLVSGMFSFELLAEDGNVLQTVNNDIDGKIKFAAITYDSAGTYKYKVREVKGNLDGVNYDERVFDVTVNVIDDEQGKLVATVDYQNNKIEFNNKYEAKTTSVSLEATKTLAGKKLVEDMFSFELLAEDGNTVLQTVNNDIDGKIKFAAITYDSAGTYKYKVREVKGNLDGVNYDERVFDVTVNVIDDEQGKLVATVSYPNNKIEFNNKYEAKATSVSLEATKTLAGKKLVEDMFSFELLADDGNTVLQTVKNDVDGKIQFSTLNFDKVGTYTYKILEVNEGLDGMTYDSQAVEVTITVTDNEKGQLEVAVKYPNKKPEFNNSYKAGSTSAVIEATKKLIGEYLVSGMFSFELLDKEGKVLQTVKNNADGTVQFATITYDTVGEYEYTVREVQGSLDGINYDKSASSITVNVIDDEQGKLVATVVYPKGKVIFENKIIQGSLEIIKTDGIDGKPLANAKFTIKDSEGKVVVSGKTDENGKVIFEGLKYGKYTYQEIAAPEGYIIDNKEYSFEIEEDRVVVKATMSNKRKPVVTTAKASTPNTGDTGISTSLVIGLIGVGGLFINNKKKKNIKGKNL